MTLTEREIITHLDKLLSFLKSVQSLANSHFASFLSKNTWNKHLPAVILSELNNISSIKEFIQLYPKIIRNNCPKSFAESHPNVVKFINTAMTLSITRGSMFIKLSEDLGKLLAVKNYYETDIEINSNMSQKKIHEVKVTSKMTAFVSHMTQSSHIVDIGGGKGYLSTLLALYYSFKVLGLDSSELRTCGASKLSMKFANLWKGEIFINPDDMQLRMLRKCNKEVRLEFLERHYKQTINFVDSDTNIEHLLQQSFNEEIGAITMTGLHTCGDLAPTCLRIFVANKKAQGLINIGCCYNLINEEFLDDNLEQDRNKNYGFPMSIFLRDQKCTLGYNMKILATHSLDRFESESDLEFSITSIFYRAILETIRIKIDPTLHHGQVGKLAKKCKNYHEYMFKGLKKLGINAQFSEKELDKFYEEYVDQKPFLTAFFLLRITLAPVIESIILLDRILYLIENGVKNVYLLPLFNLKLSPRGFGIIAWKDLDNK